MKLEAKDIQQIVSAVVSELRGQSILQDASRVGYTEVQAAEALGLPRYVLRDARLRGEISASKVGKKYVYSREALVNLLKAS